MSELIFAVVKSGMHAAWQDLGRRHSFQHGITEGGVMDIHAAMWANNLLGRSADKPLIEITMGWFELVFKTKCQIAITGANLGATLEGQPIFPWRSYAVNAGDQLKFATPQNGLRAYLAIAAECELEQHFGSVSTVVREKLGGIDGRVLRAGDTIAGIVESEPSLNRNVSQRFIPDYSEPLVLQLITGYQFDRFQQVSVEQLLNTEYQIQHSSSRMACILQGEPIDHDMQSLLSEGIAYGAVQIPPDGQPVILLNDRQTMGGYPKIGCITRLSGAALAQRAAPATVRFKTTSAEAARQEYIAHLSFFNE